MRIVCGLGTAIRFGVVCAIVGVVLGFLLASSSQFSRPAPAAGALHGGPEDVAFHSSTGSCGGASPASTSPASSRPVAVPPVRLTARSSASCQQRAAARVPPPDDPQPGVRPRDPVPGLRPGRAE